MTLEAPSAPSHSAARFMLHAPTTSSFESNLPPLFRESKDLLKSETPVSSVGELGKSPAGPKANLGGVTSETSTHVGVEDKEAKSPVTSGFLEPVSPVSENEIYSRIPSGLDDHTLLRGLCELCSVRQHSTPACGGIASSAGGGAKVESPPLKKNGNRLKGKPEWVTPPPSSSQEVFVAVSTLTLLQLQTVTLSRLMDGAQQSSRFPKPFTYFKDGSESPSFDGDEAYSGETPKALAVKFGILLTPYYLTVSAFEARSPLSSLCTYVSFHPPIPEKKVDGGTRGVHEGMEVQAIEWSWEELTRGGIHFSPNVDLSPLGSLIPSSLMHSTSAAAAAATPPIVEGGESYALGTWRGALVVAYASLWNSTQGSAVVTPPPPPSPPPPLPSSPPHPTTTTPISTLHAASLQAHSLVYQSTHPIFNFTPWGDVVGHFDPQGGRLRPSNAHWMGDTLGNGPLKADWGRFKSGLAPPHYHATSVPRLLTAFNVVINDLNEVYAPPPTPLLQGNRGGGGALTWGGLLQEGSSGGVDAISVSGCLLPGNVQRSEPEGGVFHEVFGASVRYGDGFFHFIEGLSMTFPFTEWVRSRNVRPPPATGEGEEEDTPSSPPPPPPPPPPMTIFTAHSPGYFAFLDLMRLPWRGSKGSHAGKVKAIQARVLHTSDKGLCQDFKQVNLMMGRDTLRHTLGLGPGGLMSGKSTLSVGGGKNSDSNKNIKNSNPPEWWWTVSSGLAPPISLPLAETHATWRPDGTLGDGESSSSTKNLPPPVFAPTAHQSAPLALGRRGSTPTVVLLRRRTQHVDGSTGAILPYRQLKNHGELVKGLLSLPIFLHVFDTATLATTPHSVRAMAEADVLIGVHGAGLAHSFLLRSGATLIEILPADDPGCLCFMRMALLAQLHYYALMPPGSSSASGGNMYVDVDTVLGIVSRELALPPARQLPKEG